jgi:hypothetical protein
VQVVRFPRRRFLGSSLFLLGDNLLEWLTTPLWKWRQPLEAQITTLRSTQSTGPVTFVDVGRQAGLNAPNVWGGINHKKYILEAKGSGVAFFDFDNDGWLDIYLPNGTRLETTWPSGKAPTSHLYKNNRDGTFSDVTERSGLARTGWQTGVCVGDYNNDGWDDLFCCFWGHNILFRNNGNGTFTDVTREAGLYQEPIRWGSGCCWLDYDRDGYLDLFVANYIDFDLNKVPPQGGSPPCLWKGVPVICGPRGLPPGMNLLYHNNGNGTFTDVSEKAGILKPGARYSITPVSYDFDNDGWPDIYIAVDSQPSILFKNNHDGTFTDIAVSSGCAFNQDGEEQSGMGVAVGDYDGDGWLDIFKTNFSDDSSDLYHNHGDGTFTDATLAAGLGGNRQYVGWGCGFIDYDNDGWPDIMQINGHVYPEVDGLGIEQSFKNQRLVYRNLDGKTFEDVSSTMGSGILERYSSRGAAFGDFDNDGDVDVLIMNMNDLPSLLRNDGGNQNNWIKIKLAGTKCNRTAVGARVRIVAGGRSQINEVASGGSVMSQSDLRLHFGLGKAKVVDLIEVKWPTTQKIQKFTNIQANQILSLREGMDLESWPLKRPAK